MPVHERSSGRDQLGPCSTAHDHQEDAISTDKSASWAYSEDFRTVDEVILRATDRADQLGCGAVSPGTGAVLQLLASALRATA
ncbi:MAG TPA: methyltransferase, partial [Actinotalea sp.]